MAHHHLACRVYIKSTILPYLDIWKKQKIAPAKKIFQNLLDHW
jgi:hypothetical protein